MLRIHFTSEDLQRVTVAGRSDPTWDLLLSLHVLQERTATLAFGQWRRRVRAELPKSVRLLFELAQPWGYSPDFLTPGRGDAGFDDLLDRLLSTPKRQLDADLTQLAQERPVTPWTKALATSDADALRLLGRALAAYYQRAVSPYQSRIQTHLDADRERRAKALLSGGVERLLTSLHPRARWESPVLEIPVYAAQDVHLEGRGLVLVPSFFCTIQPITLADAERPPVLVYPLPPRLGWLPPTKPPGSPDAPADPVVNLLGRTRAAVLEAATSHGSTTELAERLGVAPPVISRQAAVLREAGLLRTSREGGSVVHQVTALGLAVLNQELPT